MLVVWRPPLRLADIAAYRKLRAAADLQRQYYERVVKQVRTVVGKLQSEFCEDELDTVDDLRRQIRLLTKGTPLTESLHPEDEDPVLFSDPQFNQRQYDAQTVLLRRAFRSLASLVHPDKGGDKALFQEVDVAYKMRDLERLTAILLSITQSRNLYWQQGEGLYHVSSEYQRYGVKIEMYRQLPVWRAARMYLAGQVNTAISIVRQDLADKIFALRNEVHYLTYIKGANHGEERNQVQEIQQAGSQESESEGRDGKESEESREASEGRQEVESAGSSTSGESKRQDQEQSQES